jgi:hypothetical protein
MLAVAELEVETAEDEFVGAEVVDELVVEVLP